MLQIQETTVGEVRIISLTGKFDFFGTKHFKGTVQKARQDSISRLIVNLEKIRRVEGEILEYFASTQQSFSQIGKSLILVLDLQGELGQVLQNSTFAKLVPLFGSTAEAIEALKAVEA